MMFHSWLWDDPLDGAEKSSEAPGQSGRGWLQSHLCGSNVPTGIDQSRKAEASKHEPGVPHAWGGAALSDRRLSRARKAAERGKTISRVPGSGQGLASPAHHPILLLPRLQGQRQCPARREPSVDTVR